MEKYDYKEAVYNDCLDFISENFDADEWGARCYDYMREMQSNALIEVTGNASGSYFCDNYKAEEALCHNWELIDNAFRFYRVPDFNPMNAETMDVLIRLYLVDSGTFENAFEDFVKSNKKATRSTR